jgi:hypothetical protein
MNTKAAPTVADIACAFVQRLRAQLTPEQMDQVVARNAEEKVAYICHTHDFCDANILMERAFAKCGISPFNAAGELDDDRAQLWNEAWDAAKASRFNEAMITVLWFFAERQFVPDFDPREYTDEGIQHMLRLIRDGRPLLKFLKDPAPASLAQILAQSQLTQSQREAVLACVEVGYEGCPEDIAAVMEPLMRAD